MARALSGRIDPTGAPEAPTTSRLRPALGTLVAVSVEGAAEAALPAIEAAFARIAALESLLHPSRFGSDVARISAATPGHWVRVDGAVLELLRCARALHEATAGLFDPCLPERPGTLADLEVNADGVRCAAPVALDLGGIAKGYVVDEALAELARNGCPGGLVNAGGDLRVFGSPQTILVRRGSELLSIELRDGALAVSDARTAHRPAEHRGYYRRIGPSAPPPSSPGVYPGCTAADFAAVLAPTAMLADALTKCVLLAPDALTECVLARFGARCVR